MRQNRSGQTIVLTSTYVLVATLIHGIIVALAANLRPFVSGGGKEVIVRRVLSAALACFAVWFANQYRAVALLAKNDVEDGLRLMPFSFSMARRWRAGPAAWSSWSNSFDGFKAGMSGAAINSATGSCRGVSSACRLPPSVLAPHPVPAPMAASAPAIRRQAGLHAPQS